MDDDISRTLIAVSVLDPAIDRVRTDLVRYARTRDLDLVHALPGQSLRRVHIRPLKLHEVTHLSSAPGAASAVLGFRYAVERIENALGPNRPLAPSVLQRQEDGTDRRSWEQEDLEQILHLFGWEFMVEMAAIATDRSSQGKAWSGGVRYQLPPLCSAALDRISAQLAELADEIDRQVLTPEPASSPTESEQDSPTT